MALQPSERELILAVERAQAHAPFLAMLIDREPQLIDNLARALNDPVETVRAIEGDMPVGARLRRERRRLALLTALGDLSGAYDFTRTTRLLSDFADDALDRANRLHANLTALESISTEARDAWISQLPRDPDCYDCARYPDGHGLTKPGHRPPADTIAGLIPTTAA